MDSLITEAPESRSIPIWLVRAEDVESWSEQQGGRIATWLKSTAFRAKPGRHAILPDDDGSLAGVLVCTDGGSDTASSIWALADLPNALPPGDYAIGAGAADMDATALALGWALGGYAFDRYRTKGETLPRLVQPENADIASVRRQAKAIALVRDLINTPAEDMGPVALAAAAQDVASGYGAETEIIVGDELLARNFPLIHAVGRASADAPRLIDLRWGREDAPKVTLVGKGVCFDSGGLDIKTAAGMLLMKKDMGGAATVLGLAMVIMDAGLDVRLRVLIPAVENAISGTAFRPGDIFKSRAGTTVEIGNTDAEGRLVLADALSLAAEEEPELLIDCATLTGAARVALGPEVGVCFTDDDGLWAEIEASSSAVDDPLWRLPLWAPYRSMLDSKFADISNTGQGGFGGAITAALFLQSFAEGARAWAHFDIMAYNSRARPGRPVGGEAIGLRALWQMLEARYGG